MSRHRNVRSMNYTDEYDGYDDVYGHSLDDDYCISPSDAAFIYDRDGSRGQQKMGAFLKSDEDIAEEDETDIDKLSELDDIEKAKLNSCLEKIKSVIGEVKISEQEITSLILKYNFEVEKVIDVILSSSKFVPVEKPQIILKEKDVNKDNLSFSSLSDLVSSRENIQIPKLISSSSNVFNNAPQSNSFNSKIKDQLSTSPMDAPIRKFEVPKLFGDNSVSPVLSFSKSPHMFNNSPVVQNLTTDSSSHTSLSSLVSSHLGTTGRIEIPKLFDDNNCLKQKLTENFSKMNLNKNDSNIENEWHIDLTNALRSSTSVTLSKSKPRLVENEVIFPKNFIPPVLTAPTKKEAPKILCEFDISDMLHYDNKLESRVSRFGKIICRKYKYRSPAYFKKSEHSDDMKNTFAFNNPSPDDMILKYLKRK